MIPASVTHILTMSSTLFAQKCLRFSITKVINTCPIATKTKFTHTVLMASPHILNSILYLPTQITVTS